MIRKMLIVEDHESVNLSIQKTAEELKIAEIDYAYYCDDALHLIQKAIDQGNSYDLLITDLSFEEDHKKQEIKNGVALVSAARKIQPDLSVLVFSAESRVAIIEKLYQEVQIDGYVRKARGDAKELKKAITTIDSNKTFYPIELTKSTKHLNAHSFTELDVLIITQLINGQKQQQISTFLESKHISPSSLSSIEKRLKIIKEALNFTNNEQLIAYCIKMGIV
ncbi:response regulator transcription factor [Rhizosphaericola mali]|uniref:Response regulator transcription factor n=2 Tax=Rhizosphaericola mali TaxID=2545455 RepID=A0A5P2G587_9BACT|nr:response regulator transcription factor [Rhizosphaericola mali]